jgi:pimeloyl-ACP methyl ester carboxylesterase
MKAKQAKGFVKSYDGTRIYYETYGEGSPIVLCYGIVCTMPQWKYQLKYFKKSHQVILVDYRGHNKSSMPKNLNHLTIEACAKDVKAVMDKLEITEAVFFGHSMGVNVIFDFYKLFPQSVRAIVTICGNVKNPFETMFNSDLSHIGYELVKLSYLKFPKHFPLFWERSIASPLSQIVTSLVGFNIQLTKQKDIKGYIKGVSKQPVQTYFHLLQDMVDYKGAKYLSKIKAPTLVISGQNDMITPMKNQQFIYKKLPHAEFLKVPKGSHCSHIDMHQLVNLRIEKFLYKVT